jgi:ADP-ribosylglycohydrolase
MFETHKNKILIACFALIVAAIVVIIIQDRRIAKIRLTNKAYEAQQEELEQEKASLRRELEKTEKRIETLTQELNNIPSDEQIIYNNPISYVSVDSEWADILKPIESAIDSFRRNGGGLLDEGTSGSSGEL